MSIIMGGGNNPPIRLDPFQNIINVHWGAPGLYGVMRLGITHSQQNFLAPDGGGGSYIATTQRQHHPLFSAESVRPNQFVSVVGPVADLLPHQYPAPAEWPGSDIDYQVPSYFASIEEDVWSPSVFPGNIGFLGQSPLYPDLPSLDPGSVGMIQETRDCLVWFFNLAKLGTNPFIRFAINMSPHGYLDVPPPTTGESLLGFEIWDVKDGLAYPNASVWPNYDVPLGQLPEIRGLSESDKRVFDPITITRSYTVYSTTPGWPPRTELPGGLSINSAENTAEFFV